jgi:hypothetical protein
MTYKCKFCNSILSTEWSLQNHQKRTKRCLIKQGVVPKGEFKCDICNELFLYKIVLTTHSVMCNKKNNIEMNKNKYIELEAKYNILEAKYNILEAKYNMIIDERKELKLEQKEILDKITTSALSKTNTNNVTKNIVNISTYTRTNEEVKTIYDNNLTASHIEGGIPAIAKLIVDKVITDDNGNKMISITDKSRGTAKYKLPSGENITDVGLNSFTNTNRDIIMKRIYNIVREPELFTKVFDVDTKLCQGYNEITDDNEGEDLKRNLIKNIG